MSQESAASAIAAYCREHADEMLRVLGDIVNIDSCSPNPRGVDGVAAVLEAGLRDAGFATQRVAPPKSVEDAWLADFFLPEIGSFDLVADHLVGRKDATGGATGHALLIGHMDTAFPLGEPEHNPFRIAGDKAYGCAIADMKAGLIVILYALKALAATGTSAPKISVVYDSDEQAGSLTARPIIEGIVKDDGVTWAFKTEMGPLGGKIRRSRSSLGVALIEVEGIERHVGTGYWDGASAVEALARKVVELQALSDRSRGFLVNVGEFHGGTRRNLVAGKAYAKVDVRSHTQADWDELVSKIQAIVDEEIPGTTTRMKLINHRPAMEPTEKTERLMAVVSQAGQDLRQPIEYMDSQAGSDANFPAALGVPTLDGFGPSGAGTMTRDEWIEIKSLSDRAALLALTLHRLGSSGV